jgi:hypothetical protein
VTPGKRIQMTVTAPHPPPPVAATATAPTRAIALLFPTNILSPNPIRNPLATCTNNQIPGDPPCKGQARQQAEVSP